MYPLRAELWPSRSRSSTTACRPTCDVCGRDPLCPQYVDFGRIYGYGASRLRVERVNGPEAKVPSNLSISRPTSLTLPAPWMKARKRGRVSAPRVPSGRSIRAWSILCRGEGAQCGPTRFPNVASPPRHAGTMRFSLTAGCVSPTPPRRPRRPQPRAVKSSDRARVTAAERGNGRGPTHGNNGNKHR